MGRIKSVINNSWIKCSFGGEVYCFVGVLLTWLSLLNCVCVKCPWPCSLPQHPFCPWQALCLYLHSSASSWLLPILPTPSRPPSTLSPGWPPIKQTDCAMPLLHNFLTRLAVYKMHLNSLSSPIRAFVIRVHWLPSLILCPSCFQKDRDTIALF